MRSILYKKLIVGVMGMLLGVAGAVSAKAAETVVPIVQVSNLTYCATSNRLCENL